MNKISFARSLSEVRFLNPMKEFAEDVQTIEVRFDPLLGDTSVHNPFLRDKAKAFFGECDQELIGRLVEESAKTCFFCGEGVLKSTPRFATDFHPEGRIRVNEAVLFPNLFSLGTHHPVIRLCDAHFLRLAEFRPELLRDGFEAARRFLRIAGRKDPAAACAAITANYLFPAGASLVHPHLQMLLTQAPYSYQSRLLSSASAWRKENGSVYFDDLRDAEQNSGRFVCQTGRWSWMAAFSPIGSNEVMAVHASEPDFGMLEDDDLLDLAGGISRVLSCYETLGYLSFNYAVYSVKSDRDDGSFRCLIKIISRQNLYPNYRNDDYFLQKLLQSELIIVPPEELAGRLRPLFA